MAGSNFNPCVQYGYNPPAPYLINFFVPNPYVAELTVTDDNSHATYNALQMTVRHRLSGGLTVTANYAFSRALSDMYGGGNPLTNYYATIRDFGLNKGPIPRDVRQAFQSYFTYNLPSEKGGRSLSQTASWTGCSAAGQSPEYGRSLQDTSANLRAASTQSTSTRAPTRE